MDKLQRELQAVKSAPSAENLEYQQQQQLEAARGRSEELKARCQGLEAQLEAQKLATNDAQQKLLKAQEKVAREKRRSGSLEADRCNLLEEQMKAAQGRCVKLETKLTKEEDLKGICK